MPPVWKEFWKAGPFESPQGRAAQWRSLTTFVNRHSSVNIPLKKHNIVHIQRTATIVCKTCLMTTVGGPSLVNSVAKNSQQSRVLKFMLGFMVGKKHIIVKYVRNHLTRLGTWEDTWKKYMDQKLRWLIAHWYNCLCNSFNWLTGFRLRIDFMPVIWMSFDLE